jgi:hypothetical protein
MIGCVLGADEREAADRLARLREATGLERPPHLAGTVEPAAGLLREHEAAGVERAMLQHLVHEDVETVALMGELPAALS